MKKNQFAKIKINTNNKKIKYRKEVTVMIK
jgi:hypothetical protein